MYIHLLIYNPFSPTVTEDFLQTVLFVREYCITFSDKECFDIIQNISENSTVIAPSSSLTSRVVHNLYDKYASIITIDNYGANIGLLQYCEIRM